MNRLFCWKRPFFPLTILIGLLLAGYTTAFAHPAQETDIGRTILDKTFVFRNDIWIDTAYDPAKHPLYRIGVQSEAYDALAASLPNVRRYRQLGDTLLLVHDGWAIELNSSAEAGPFVANETRQPRFLAEYRPVVESPRPIASGSGNKPPTLLATTPSESGLNINIHIGWSELTVLLIVVGLVGTAVWLAYRDGLQVESPTE